MSLESQAANVDDYAFAQFVVTTFLLFISDCVVSVLLLVFVASRVASILKRERKNKWIMIKLEQHFDFCFDKRWISKCRNLWAFIWLDGAFMPMFEIVVVIFIKMVQFFASRPKKARFLLLFIKVNYFLLLFKWNRCV